MEIDVLNIGISSLLPSFVWEHWQTSFYLRSKRLVSFSGEPDIIWKKRLKDTNHLGIPREIAQPEHFCSEDHYLHKVSNQLFSHHSPLLNMRNQWKITRYLKNNFNMSKAKANRKQQLKGNRAHEGRRKKNFNIALIILRKKVMHLV